MILIDNGSIDGTADYFQKLKEKTKCGGGRNLSRLVIVISKDNIGVSGALNRGIKVSRGNHICYLNNDVIVTSGWLEKLIRCAESDKKIGIVGCSTHLPGNDEKYFKGSPKYKDIHDIQRTSIAISMSRKNIHPMEAAIIKGLCMFIKRKVVEKIGLFDERFHPCTGEDIDYSFRAREAGFRLVNAMDVFIFHFLSKSTRSNEFDKAYGSIKEVIAKAKVLLVSKWGKAGASFCR